MLYVASMIIIMLLGVAGTVGKAANCCSCRINSWRA